MYNINMALDIILKNPTVDLLSLIKKYKREQIASDLNSVLVNDYKELAHNEVYIKNFLELVSYIYAYEQLNKQKTEKQTSLNTSLFDDNFRRKLRALRNEYVHNNPLSR